MYTTRPCSREITIAAMAAMMGLAPGLAMAQGPRGGAAPPMPVVTGDPTRRDINVPEDVPNISGMWQPQTFFRTIRPADGSATPFLPWAKEFFLNRARAEARAIPRAAGKGTSW